jgi:hypothetical protein
MEEKARYGLTIKGKRERERSLDDAGIVSLREAVEPN